MGLQLGCTSFKALLPSTGAPIPPAEDRTLPWLR